MWAFVVNQPGVQLPARAPDGIKYAQIVKSSEMKMWVSQSDSMPAQASLKVNIEVNQSQVPKLPGPILVNLNLNIQFGGFNQPMTIDLPAEASASDVPDLKDLKAAVNNNILKILRGRFDRLPLFFGKQQGFAD